MRRLCKILIILITMIVSVFFGAAYHSRAKVFYGDALGYYLYLPATFIHDNFTTIEKAPAEGLGDIFYQESMYFKTPKGYSIIQYTYGVALMEAPFFLAAHIYEKLVGGPAHGYTDTYKIAIQISSLVYALLGLLILYRVLRRYFSDTVSLITVCFILVGTNLLWFSMYQAGMSHVPLFFLYALLIYLTILLHERGTLWLFLSTALTAALIVVIRPSDVTCLLIPLLYNVSDKRTLSEKITFIRKNTGKLLLAIVIAFIPFIPQLIYWKFISGSYVFDSYQGQTFNWTTPRIIEGLFYPSNGWLAYSPIMVFAVFGFLCYKTIRQWAWTIYIMFPIYCYIIYSWYCYNYINGFGSRPMIHIYPLLAIPLAAFLLYVSRRGMVAKAVVGTFSMFFIFVNISYSTKTAERKLKSDGSNMPYNLQVLFKRSLSYKDLVVADVGEFQPDTNKIKKIAVLACEQFNDPTSPDHIRDSANENNFIYHLPADKEYQEKGLTIHYNKQLFGNAKWIKCSGRFKLQEHWGDYYMHMLVLQVRRGDQYVHWYGLQIDNKIGTEENKHLDLYNYAPGIWGEVYYFVPVPKDMVEGDQIDMFVWNMPGKPLYTDNYCLELYE